MPPMYNKHLLFHNVFKHKCWHYGERNWSITACNNLFCLFILFVEKKENVQKQLHVDFAVHDVKVKKKFRKVKNVFSLRYTLGKF